MPHRVQQNLSFVIVPLKRFIRTARDSLASMSIVCGVPKPWGNIGVVFVAYPLLQAISLAKEI